MSLRKYFSNFAKLDWLLLGAVFLLMCFGLSAIYSIAISAENPDLLNFKKQIIFGAFGLLVMFSLAFINYNRWHDLSYLVYGAGIVLLVLVLFLGRTVQGTTGWFSLFGINIQPVEFAKIALIITLAWFLSLKGESIRELKNFIISGLIAAIYFGLVILQPDFGSGVILFLIWLFMMIFAKADKKHLFLLALMMIVSFFLAWNFFFAPYQKDRIITFFQPQANPYGSGYHVRQAMTAVGAGGWLGRGLGFGSQSQLKFVPAATTDFIFAVIAEELGFVGVGVIFFLFALIFYRLIRAAKKSKNNFSLLVILGVTSMLFCQVMINIGMNIGIVPVTGISLPFLSYGGSYLVSALGLIGIVQSIIIRSRS